MDRKTIKIAFLDTIPVMTGYVVLGIGFGIVLQQHGYGILWSFAMSTLIYAGSMQYVGVGLLSGGAGVLATAMTTLMVNARHLFYGISMIDAYRGTGRRKPYLIFGLTDETYSLVSREQLPENAERNLYFFLVTLFDQCYWIAGSVIGSAVGNLPIDFTGIDFSLTALFVTIFTEQWLSTENHLPAIIGVVSAVLCLLLFGADSFLIPTMLLIAAALIMTRRVGKEATHA